MQYLVGDYYIPAAASNNEPGGGVQTENSWSNNETIRHRWFDSAATWLETCVLSNSLNRKEHIH